MGLFTVDLEEYFHAAVFAEAIPVTSWSRQPSRIDRQTDQLLELLAMHGARGTFFVLGWIAERYPALIRRIAQAGHEIASHGHFHLRVRGHGPRVFRAEVRDSRASIEEVTGRSVMGYRAPNFSLTPGHEWAFDILLEEGYRYDSSLFPIRRPGYGHPGALDRPFWIPRLDGKILEVPPTVLTIFGIRIPAAGGAYLRHFPRAVTAAALRRSRMPMVYIHPWEIDPEQPRILLPALSSHRHYAGLAGTLTKLDQVLRQLRFTTIADAFRLGAGAACGEPAGAVR